MWSVDREEWIALGELQEYEHVQTRSGTIHLLSLQRALPADVFNIEVDCHQVYEFGDAGVLVHNSCFRALEEADLARYLAGQRILPKGISGTITDHVKGYPTGYISASLDKAGAALYDSGSGITRLDIKKLLETGSGISSHQNVIQHVRNHGRLRDLENVLRAKEILITGGIDPRAILELLL